MQPSLPERYPNWREVYPASARTPQSPGQGSGESDYLRRKLTQLADLCLTSTQVHARFVVDLKRFVTLDGRQDDPELQQLIEDYGAMALGYYTQDSAKALRMAIERVHDGRPSVIVHTITQPAPRQRSLTERILGR